jgi:SAM-dependent methyltransferase
VPLPFDDDTFDLVTCLEALEFMPDTRAALAECARVLKPGGLLLVSNRIATGAKVMPGKTFPKAKFEALLQDLGQSDVTTQVWQFDYDLVWSIKPDYEANIIPNPEGMRTDTLLRCPMDRAPLDRADTAYHCRTCSRRYPIGPDGVIELMSW